MQAGKVSGKIEGFESQFPGFIILFILSFEMPV